MTGPNFRHSDWFDDVRATHRGERAPEELRRRSLARFDARYSESGASAEDPSAGVARVASAAVRRLLPFFSTAALGAGLLWTWARLTSHPDAAPPADLESATIAADVRLVTAARPCPLDELPSGSLVAPFAPTVRHIDLVVMGLSVHTFDAQTPSCGPLTRRYLELVPTELQPKTRAPVMLVLHDAGQSAEQLRIEQTRWYFDTLAKQHGFVLIYANAAPSRETVAAVQNSGGWQTDTLAHREIDDEAYLGSVVGDLKARGVIEGSNDVWLVGFGAGATMALSAAAHHPDRYAGVAAFEPKELVDALPSDPSARRLARVLMVVSGHPRDVWGGALQRSAERWALASSRVPGVPSPDGPSARFTGKDHWGWFDVRATPDARATVRVLVLDGATDAFPPPGAADSISLAAAQRRPNFVNGAEQALAFLSDRG